MRYTTTDDLINFWKSCPMIGDMLCHVEDQPHLTERHIIKNPLTFGDGFVLVKQTGKISLNHRFHLSLMPVPYMGNLKTADIFVLLLNPGFNFVDYYAEKTSHAYRLRLQDNLAQDFRGAEFPFLCLDPEFSWHSGFGWWEGKLRTVIGKIAAVRYNGRYIDALQDLSSRIAVVEMVPYHSASFDMGGHWTSYHL